MGRSARMPGGEIRHCPHLTAGRCYARWERQEGAGSAGARQEAGGADGADPGVWAGLRSSGCKRLQNQKFWRFGRM